ncbi:Alpha/beta hydrolase fold [Enterobacter sp. FY-07]|uniref:pyrimidine utilization protein D n=1 Tax=Kosakonia oryzendophytica TaxID=1005665 RepID=UPI0007776F99|nr:pyrimidine utilization protein D [Kosakonia oryzendophytica]AMO48931.1 Alpha/beta hydrolase fold [Enterobacter sp. FY-07]WBT56574.1 pyrimidine utilization protein D [Kosakonia oryzendophytica]
MKLTLSAAPFADAPVVVLSAGLGGAGSYWLAQLAALEAHYQVVRYDQRGTGNNPDTLPEGYRMQDMAAELHQALGEAGIHRYCVAGHALGALIGLQLALDHPDAVSGLVLVNGWLTLNDHTRRCFQVRERLLQAGGAEAWVQAQPLFLYPADWMAAHAPRMEAEDALAVAHFQGETNLLRRLNALKAADFSAHAMAIQCPTLIICSRDDLLVPWTCSRDMQQAIPDSQLRVMERGAHACNISESTTFNTLLLSGLASMLPTPTPFLKENV